jgi:predicted AlkP superfamily phosphohydrolase/phosphomutase
MKYHPPRPPHASEAEFELYKDVVTAGYQFFDLMLHRLLELAGEDTTVILLSDHGFHSDHLRHASIPKIPAGPAVEHRPFGVLTMNG